MPAGRPTKHEEDMNRQAYRLCLLGAKDEDLADFFEVDESTINRWKKSKPEFCKSLKRGKQDADSKIAESLYHRAKGYIAPEIITAQKDGIITDIKHVLKYYPPDTTAAIYWLKNRNGNWKDKQETEISGAIDINTEMIEKYLKR